MRTVHKNRKQADLVQQYTERVEVGAVVDAAVGAARLLGRYVLRSTTARSQQRISSPNLQGALQHARGGCARWHLSRKHNRNACEQHQMNEPPIKTERLLTKIDDGQLASLPRVDDLLSK